MPKRATTIFQRMGSYVRKDPICFLRLSRIFLKGVANMTEEDRIFSGILFCPGSPELRAIKLRAHNLSSLYSRTLEDETE